MAQIEARQTLRARGHPSEARPHPPHQHRQAYQLTTQLRRAARASLQTADVSGLRTHMGWVRRGDLTDAQWRRLEPHLPPEKPRTGRPNAPHRRIVNGILWILRTGVWDRMLAAPQSEADARGEVDWDLHYVDAAIIRGHQHAAGARRDGAIEG